MMIKSGLKGHHNLAQGKATRGSVALGLIRAIEIDRKPAPIKKISYCGRNGNELY